MTHFVENYGLWVVFIVVLLEVSGLPFIPGETALIAAGVLASQGHGSIVWTIVLAILAAVLGAAFGYVVGRIWGRRLLQLWPWLERLTRSGIERSDEFFHRHGARAVVLGRFVPVVRATIGWMAGVGRMAVLRFMVANVVGAVAWATAIGVLAYYVGGTIIDYGTYAIGAAAAVILVVWVVHQRRRNRA